jgi:two-component system CheB/CheR fusion protein
LTYQTEGSNLGIVTEGMAKKSHVGKPKSSARASSRSSERTKKNSSTRRKSSKLSLSKELIQLKEKADELNKEASLVARGSGENYAKADAAHTGVETMHQDVDKLHQRLKRTTKSRGNVPENHFIVVGVGASAGGFEAFASLLRELPGNTGMAFVFIQHLDPDHSSQLTELLQRACKMPVREITNRVTLQPNSVYVIPPNFNVVVEKGRLLLSIRNRSALNLPVDQFLKSLAIDNGNRAVGVILSGSGHDGAIGLTEIKAEGGITFAQDEQSAKYYSMPQSASAAGCVDFVLPPEQIARELVRIAGQLGSNRSKTMPPPAFPGTEEDLAKLFTILRGVTGVDFSAYKPSTLKRRIARRLVLKKMRNLREYLRYLQKTPVEIDDLFQEILINVTSFFRDPNAFVVLNKRVFPKLLKQRDDATIRIWVPGCSTGEEVYSHAICLHEFLGRKASGKNIQIFGTDISDRMVARARQGIYSSAALTGVSPERLRRYFNETDSGYQIAKFIRDMCVFAKQNLLEDPPFSKVDLISCRNLLIYFGPTLQRKVLPIFHYSLRHGGYLLLGSSETIAGFSNLFTLIDKRNKIYLRNETYERTEAPFKRLDAPERLPVDDKTAPRKEPLPKSDLQRQADELVLSRYMPPGLIVNSRMEVLHFRGKTGPYLEPSPGTASFSLTKIVRAELAMDLRSVFNQVLRTNNPARKEGIRIRYHDHFRLINFEIAPLPRTGERLFLILFFDVREGDISKPGSKTGKHGRNSDRELVSLRDELGQTKESLQSIIEEQESTNEELRSANEEIQSTNEELQSTNEELETAKEELQSTNEELTTLNEELQNRNSELSSVNNDLNNLIASFAMPILILGTDSTVRRFTPMAQKLFNLIPADIGRRITDIKPNINLPDLDTLAAEVIETLNVKELHATDNEGRTFSVRIRPYRTAENTIEGVVVVAVDTGDPWRDISDVAEMVSEPILLLTNDLRIRKANTVFHLTFEVASGETEGRFIHELGNGQWNIPALKDALLKVLPEEGAITNFRVAHQFPGIGERAFLVNARRLARNAEYIVVAFKEIPID